MTTYGFEAEFQVNASAVIAGLHERELSGDRTLHGYHCDCDYCQFNNGFPFRGQTDSSCSGEIISDIFGSTEPTNFGDGIGPNYSDETALMCALADVAVEVDAEPGTAAGFHVHVGVTGLSPENLQNSLWEFLKWEPVLARIAGGRWSERRSGNNTPVRDQLRFVSENYGLRRNTTGGLLDLENELADNPGMMREFKQQLVYSQIDNDRHSNLNIGQHSHPTWEFRIWNSTRSAWRMEMFCGLSVAFMDPEVILGLSELSAPRRMSQPSTGIDSIALACDAGGWGRTAELLERQGHYLNDRAETAPSVLTAV